MNTSLNILSSNWMVYDVETQRDADAVGGWDNKADMGISIAVVYEARTDKYHVFYEWELDDCIELLKSADYVVAFNQISFDNIVLGAYADDNLNDALNNIDILDIIHRILGHRVKLDGVAQATLGISKSASGLEALKWYEEGDFCSIIEYCIQDVRVTKEVFEFAVKNGFLCYPSRTGNKVVNINFTN